MRQAVADLVQAYGTARHRLRQCRHQRRLGSHRRAAAGRVGPHHRHQPARHLSHASLRRAASQEGRAARSSSPPRSTAPAPSRSAGATAYSATKAGAGGDGADAGGRTRQAQDPRERVCPGKIDTEITDNTEKRHTEEAEVPADFQEGRIPLTDDEPGNERGGGGTRALPRLRPRAPHHRHAGLDRRRTIARRVGSML